ncbi:efflux RND transporter periplasmic adaptor subunit [Solemya elarraichensis gill symbiont]|uniref:Efflux transporter periplasmic adaptor subunit n=1 Tax=Solemya elarraichensis gill symbiont TaxID=1918949 RepID=A0A1T2L5A1_9GAMM|nr:efflux RND transporter periplasmic adaptor subunit [Solemya elarraichensis gill symbiont]OOZ40241.1 efflux transporter periplasmic adaptor subunit [Solemya elarraichensis gill symbiont]
MSKASRLKPLWIIPPIVIGVLVLMYMNAGKKTPIQIENAEVSRVVRTIKVPQVDLQPVTEGYGVVQPAKIWSAVAQVTGRVIEMHPRLRDGEIIAAGTPLFRIDPVDYELALAQLKAELAEIEVQQNNTKDLLVIEQRNLELAGREADRLKKLAEVGTTSGSDTDQAERTMLNSRTSVQNLQNSLALLPTQRKVIEAKLAQAERDLENTSIKAPFNLRIANLSIETDQFVTTGQTLFQGDSVDRSEIVAQVAMSSLRHLFFGRGADGPNTEQLGAGFAEYVDFRPVIQMDMGGDVAEWDAEFVRFTDSIDSQTRTIGIVVALDKPFEKVIPGHRPPLSKGMFVKVLLRGRIQPRQIVIPRSAVRDGKVLIVNSEQRLVIKDVEFLYHQDDLSVIQSGIEAGQQLVVSDLIPAVEGMLLQPQHDQAVENKLLRSAGAE